MPDEVTVKPKSETTTATTAPDNQTVTVSRAQIVNLCALGLGICFFLPWATWTPRGFWIHGFIRKRGGRRLVPLYCRL